MEASVHNTFFVPPLESLTVMFWGLVASKDDPRRVSVFPSSEREETVGRFAAQACQSRLMALALG